MKSMQQTGTVRNREKGNDRGKKDWQKRNRKDKIWTGKKRRKLIKGQRRKDRIGKIERELRKNEEPGIDKKGIDRKRRESRNKLRGKYVWKKKGSSVKNVRE